MRDDLNDILERLQRLEGMAGGNASSSSPSATDNAIMRADGTSGRLVQGSTVTIDDAGQLFVVIPYDKTDTNYRTYSKMLTNDAAVPFGLAFFMKGAVSLSGRQFLLQTADVGSANGGTLWLQPFAGGVAFGLSSIPAYANNAAALAGGLTAGMLYRTSADPSVICIVT
jgi:hypothetical protein